MKRLNYKELGMKDFWLRLWKLIQSSHKQIYGVVFYVVLFELVRFISPYLLKLIIDLISNFNRSQIRQIFILILAMLAAELFGG